MLTTYQHECRRRARSTALLIVLMFLAGEQFTPAQTQIVPMLSYNEQSFTTVIVNKTDTIVAGHRSALGVLRNGELVQINVPGRAVDIIDGIALDGSIYLLDASGSVLAVRAGSVSRIEVDARVIGLGRYRDSLAIVTASSMFICDTTGAAVYERTWSEAVSLRSGSVIGDVVVGVTQTHAVVRIRAGEVRVLDTIRGARERYVSSRDLLFISGSSGALCYSTTYDRTVMIDVQGAQVDDVIQRGSTKYITHSSVVSDTVMVSLNRPFGNRSQSPVLLCRISDTTLFVESVVTPSILATAELIESIHIVGRTFVGVGYNSRIVSYDGAVVRYPLGYQSVEIVQAAKARAGTACLVYTQHNDSVKGLLRMRSSSDRSFVELPLFDLPSNLVPACSVVVGGQYVYLSRADTMYRVVIDDAKAKQTGTAMSVHDLVAFDDYLVYTASIAARSFISVDEGSVWHTVSGGKLTVGGDGRLYSRVLGSGLRAVVIGDEADSVIVKLPVDQELVSLFPSSRGVVAVTAPPISATTQMSLTYIRTPIDVVVVTYRLPASRRWDLSSTVLLDDSTAAVFTETLDYYCVLSSDGMISTPVSTDVLTYLTAAPFVISMQLSSDGNSVEALSAQGDVIHIPLARTTSVDDEPILQWVAVQQCYPNPTAGDFTVRISALPTADYSSWRFALVSLDGDYVLDLKPTTKRWTNEVYTQDIPVRLGNLPQGRYLIVSSNRGYVESRQVVIVR